MKTQMLLLYTVTMLLSLGLSACAVDVMRGSGRVVSEERAVSDFTKVEFLGYGEITIIQGESESLTIETDDNLLPLIQSRVSGGVLTLDIDNRSWRSILRPTRSIRYTLTLKTLDHLDLAGAGTVYAAQLKSEALTLNESGAGTITIDQLTASDLNGSMSGAGTVELGGEVARQRVEMSGFGSYEAGDLKSEEAEITLSGAGTATVWVTGALVAEHSGAGAINYYGSPQARTSASGVGGVQGLGDK